MTLSYINSRTINYVVIYSYTILVFFVETPYSLHSFWNHILYKEFHHILYNDSL